MIIVEDVHKRYRTEHGPGKWVLQGVSVTIPPRLNVGLVGGNGAGKSTLLRLIGGIDTPDKGRVERHSRVSWPMGLSGGLQVSLTGRQNAKFICRIHGHEDEMLERIAAIQDFAELGGAFDEPVRTYSSGMRSRLQFALSLAFDFDVYISDEVTAAGDASFRDKASKAFKKIADHASLIMVSHGEGTLRQFCEAGIFLNEGRAHWFDDINDALREYKKIQLHNRVLNLTSAQAQGRSGQHDIELEKVRQSQNVLAMLERGMGGTPEKVGHEEGVKIMALAREMGMELVTEVQVPRLGYQLKPNVTPAMVKAMPPHNRFVDFYDLTSQSVKVEGSK